MSKLLDDIEKMKYIRQVDFVSTGSLVLDYIISGKADGSGGWPIGQIGEISGDPYSGKSMCVQRTAAMFQQKFGDRAFIFYDDDEHSVTANWIEKIGVKLDHTFLCTSLHPEAVIEFTESIMGIKDGWASSITSAQCFQRIRAMCGSKELADRELLFIVDSIGEMSCIYEVEHDGERVDQGQRAKEIRQAIRLTTIPLAKRKALLLVTNHNTTGPGGYGGMSTTAGGGGFKFGSTVRLDFSKPAKIKEGEEIVGNRLFVEVTKSRYVPPFSKAELNLYWDKAIPKYEGMVEQLVKLGKIDQHGGWYTLPNDEKKWRKSELLELMESGGLDELLKEVSK